MRKQLYTFLNPPSLHNSEDARLARILHVLLLVIAASLVIVLVPSLLSGRLIAATGIAVAMFLLLAAFVLNWRQQVRAATTVLLVTFLCIATYLLWNGDGLQDVAIVIYPLLLVVGGVLGNRPTFLLTVVLSLVSLAATTLGQLNGLIIVTPEQFAPAYDLLIISSLLLITAVTVRSFVNNWRSDLLHLREKEQALAAANEELRREIEERNHIEVALQASQAELQTRTESQAIVNTISQSLHRSLDLDIVAEQAVADIAAYYQAPLVMIYVLEADDTLLAMVAAHGMSEEALDATAILPVENSLNGYVIAHKEMLICNDLQHDERVDPDAQEASARYRLNSAIVVPLMVQKQVIGTINLLFQRAQTLTADGKETLQAIANAISLAMANARHVMQKTREIRERKRVQAALKESEQRYRSVLENMGQGLTITDKDGQFLFVNRAFSAMVGYSDAELIGKTPFDIAVPTVAHGLEQEQEIRRSGQANTYETQLRHKDGTTVDVMIAGVPQWQETEYTGSIAVVTDLTERKQAEIKQLWLTNQLRTAADVARQVNVILDPEILLRQVVALLQSRFNLYHVHVYLLHEESQRLLMVAGSGEVGRRLQANRHAILVQEPHSLVARAAREHRAIVANRVKTNPDFLPNPLLPGTQSEIAVPLTARDRMLGVLDVQDDRPERFTKQDKDVFQVLAHQITIALQNATLFAERQQAEEQLAELVAELEARNAELERFNYTVSHDLKSPLITIQGFLGLLEKDIAAGDMRRVETDIERIQVAANTMDQLLHDLLELSRIGRIINPPEWASFGEIVVEALDRVTGQLAARPVDLVIAPEFPDVYVDRSQLVEVIQNLLDNAIKFMGSQPEPRIEIGVRLDRQEPVLFVQDNGVGIDERFHEKVFGLFDRLNPDIDGTGIGLALVQRIIELHGGRVWIESEGPEKGTTFCFTLPWRE